MQRSKSKGMWYQASVSLVFRLVCSNHVCRLLPERHGNSSCTSLHGCLRLPLSQVMMEGRISKAADVYAFGILLWELFCGGSPFAGMCVGEGEASGPYQCIFQGPSITS